MQVLGKLAAELFSKDEWFKGAVRNEDWEILQKAMEEIQESMVLAKKIETACRDGNSAAVRIALKHVFRRVSDLNVGRWLLVPSGTKRETQQGLEETDLMIVVHRKSEDEYSVWVVNSGDGVEFHPCLPSVVPAKFRRRVAIKLGVMSKEKITDTSWWLYVLMMR